MNLSNSQLDQAMRADPALAEAVEELTARLKAGQAVDLDAWLAERPEYADELRRLFPMLRMLADLSRSGASAPAIPPEEVVSGLLGDFRILREVGKGGMGIVYEAEQISLRRRVALKVLPFAATMDSRHLQRFHNEAQAAACLHHTNIVPVYFVGSERGVHFYAMQFIEGQPLSDVIHQMRRAEWKAAKAGEDGTIAYQTSPGEAASTPPVAAMTPLTAEGRRNRDYYRKVAELGIQAAEALDHAHQLGIVHRDIKPANLMLDGMGRVWVTDFGLAHMQHGEASLTGTGQMVGTPRYMSPEQALSKRVLIDHRTDVYSLGATLYELLTLRPAFPNEDRNELLRQIAFEEPAKPRRLERAIPAELETIVLKAMEKRPQDRYATAQELADDLRRWLLDQPIRARRPSWIQVGRKWVRRHRVLVTAAALCLLVSLAALAGSVGWVLGDQAARQREAEQKANVKLQEVAEFLRQEKHLEARGAIEAAESMLAGASADSTLQSEIDQFRRDLRMAQRLEEARLELAKVQEGRFNREAEEQAYAAAFQDYGLDVEGFEPQQVQAQILARPIARQLVAALDEWAFIRRKSGKEWERMLEVVRAADPDEWRNQFREAFLKRDRQALEQLAASVRGKELAPTTLVLLAEALRKTGSPEASAPLLQQAWKRHPADFWINHELAQTLFSLPNPQVEESIRYYTAAVVLRPGSPGAHLNRGRALHRKGELEGAIAEFQEAIALNPEYAEAHSNLGVALRDKGQLDKAMTILRRAIELKKGLPEAHCCLGVVLCSKGLVDEGIKELQEAIRLKQDFAEAYTDLGGAFRMKNRLDEAIEMHREAIRLKPDFAGAHYNLGSVLGDMGRLDEAADELRKAIQLRKEDPQAHYGLGTVLMHQDRLDEAIDELQETIRLNKNFASAHCNLGAALKRKGQFADALRYYRRGHELGSKNPNWRGPSARWVRECELLVELDAKLPAILSGQKQPADNAERIALAKLCQLPCKQQYLTAERFYSAAFAEEPKLSDDLNAQHRYNAACAAALAGCGQGKDADTLDVKERARLRQQALDWLRADLKAYQQAMEKSAGKAGPMIAQRMQHWLQDSDFAGVRGDEDLAKLPEEERRAWRKLWAEVAEMLAKAQVKAPAEKKVDTK